MTNLFANLPARSDSEFLETLLEAGATRIERIVSHGHASPEGFWYDQEQGEWVALFQGAARLRFEDEVADLRPGDCINIPAHRRHRVEWTSPDEPTIWLAVFYGESGRK
jgi:cupin 2 domain-containing protein